MSKYQAKKIDDKMMLISRDIQVGDEVDYKGQKYKVTEDSLESAKVSKDTVKAIGVISADATWVKEGDEFDEDQVSFIDEPGEDMDTVYVPLSEFESYYESRGYRKPFPDYLHSLTIGIKGQCGHFH